MPELLKIDELERRLLAAKESGLELDLTRGKPSAAQLDLSASLLEAIAPADCKALDGSDCRNYGGADGLSEVKALYAQVLGVGNDEILIGDNASLALMHAALAQAFLAGVADGDGPWSRGEVRFLCPVPGYDRHFGICEYMGIEMLTVPMTDKGPDMEAVAELAAGDSRVKGIFCVPRYSNPTGVVYSADTVRALAGLETAAADFRIIWDNAYAVHHLYDDRAVLEDILGLCKDAGHPNRPLLFGSTSKGSFVTVNRSWRMLSALQNSATGIGT